MSQLAMHSKSSTLGLPQNRLLKTIVCPAAGNTVPQLRCLTSSAWLGPKLAPLRLETDPLQ